MNKPCPRPEKPLCPDWIDKPSFQTKCPPPKCPPIVSFCDDPPRQPEKCPPVKTPWQGKCPPIKPWICGTPLFIK
ncbi:MAG: hypothetical protein ACAI44_11790 [Candidatus Sericytochromatia bacterium]